MTIAERINNQFKGMTKNEVRKYCFENKDLQLYADYLNVIYFDKLQDRFKESEYKRLFTDGKTEKKQNVSKKEINIPKHENNTVQPIIDLEKVPNELKDTIKVIVDKEDYRQAKCLMIKYVNYMYIKHKSVITPKEIELIYKESDLLSQRELENAINTVIAKGYKYIKFFAFKDVSRTKFDNFQERTFSRMAIYQFTKEFYN